MDWAPIACESDPVVAARFFKVNGLLDPPIRLLHPAFICRVAAIHLRRHMADIRQTVARSTPTRPRRDASRSRRPCNP